MDLRCLFRNCSRKTNFEQDTLDCRQSAGFIDRTILPLGFIRPPRRVFAPANITSRSLVFRDSILFTIKSPWRLGVVYYVRGGLDGVWVRVGFRRDESWVFAAIKCAYLIKPESEIDGPPTIIAVMELAHLSAARSGGQHAKDFPIVTGFSGGFPFSALPIPPFSPGCSISLDFSCVWIRFSFIFPSYGLFTARELM